MIELPDGRTLTLTNRDGMIFVTVAGYGEEVRIVRNVFYRMGDGTVVIWDAPEEGETNAT